MYVADLLIKVFCAIWVSIKAFPAALDSFMHLPYPWSHVVSISAVIGLEAALLLSWFTLDNHRHLSPQAIVTSSITLTLSYTAFLIICLPSTSSVIAWLVHFIMLTMIVRSTVHAGFPRLVASHFMDVLKREDDINLDESTSFAGYTSDPVLNFDFELNKARLEIEKEIALAEVEFYKEMLKERAYAKANLAKGQLLAKLAQEDLIGVFPSSPLDMFDKNSLEIRN